MHCRLDYQFTCTLHTVLRGTSETPKRISRRDGSVIPGLRLTKEMYFIPFHMVTAIVLGNRKLALISFDGDLDYF